MLAHEVTFTVRFSDVDSLGHVNNAVYLSYCEEARINWLRTSGLFDNPKIPKTLPLILARAEIDFLKPAYLGDSVTVRTEVSRLGTKSFDMDYLVECSEGPLARSRAVLVWFDQESGKSAPFPEGVRAFLEDELKTQQLS